MEYSEKAHEGANLMEAGALEQAAALFHALVESDISDIDKCLTFCSVAVFCERIGLPEDVFQWYDAAAAYEQPHNLPNRVLRVCGSEALIRDLRFCDVQDSLPFLLFLRRVELFLKSGVPFVDYDSRGSE